MKGTITCEIGVLEMFSASFLAQSQFDDMADLPTHQQWSYLPALTRDPFPYD